MDHIVIIWQRFGPRDFEDPGERGAGFGSEWSGTGLQLGTGI